MKPLNEPLSQLRPNRRWLFLWAIAVLAAMLLFSPVTLATTGELDLTSTGVGFFAIGIFVLAYMLVIAEENDWNSDKAPSSFP